MRINLALLNILHSPRKTALSVAGIGIAILLIFMQLGFRGAVENTATNIYGKLDFDILLRSADYLHFVDSGKFERQFLDYAAGLSSVESATHLNVAIANWRNPDKGTSRGMMVLGVSPLNSPFDDDRVDSHFGLLKTDQSVLVDRQSHFEFGPLNGSKFTDQDIHRKTELGGKTVKIVETFSMGAGLAANGASIVSGNGFKRIFPHINPERISFGLIKVNSGESVDDVAAELNRHFKVAGGATSVQVLPRREVVQLELDRWLGETPIGFIFTLGVLIALIVGAAIVYMVLGNDVANRLHEYATMRAMGYSNQYLGLMVLKQAGYLALFSFTPALLLALFLYWVTGMLANITMEMNLQRIVFVLTMTLIMCGFSGVLAMKKLWQAEPAELF
jgi:putative ABC transport system permease protein